MNANDRPRAARAWTPQSKRRRGKPKQTFIRTVEKERAECGFKGRIHAGVCAEDRKRGERDPKVLFSCQGKGNDDDVVDDDEDDNEFTM